MAAKLDYTPHGGLVQIESKEEKKIPKAAVLYAFRPETQYTCAVCAFARDSGHKCALFGSAPDIKPYGTCGLWLHASPDSPDIPWLGVITPEEAGYEENKTGFSCKRCEYYGGMDCSKVDKDSPGDTPGVIHPNACCNRWEADAQRASMPPDKLAAAVKAMGTR